MKIKGFLAAVLIFSGIVFLLIGCASAPGGGIEIDAETGEIIEE